MKDSDSRALGVQTAIFLSAFLLFQVQPIIGRYILPWFGGGPSVWANCLLFFQAVLLAGYAYAHWLGSWRAARAQAVVHIALLLASLAFLPIGPAAAIWKPVSSDDPAGKILWLLAATIGGPYFVLSATAPLVQRWWSRNRPGESPYRLYALSNLGSFLALLSYPFAVEPFLRLRTQTGIWSILYVAFVVACGWTAWRLRPSHALVTEEESEASTPPRPAVWTILYWLGLSTAGSTLLVSTTNQITQGIVVIPFLWVAPLSIYLLTFILTFHSEHWYKRLAWCCAAGVLAPVACGIAGLATVVQVWVLLGVYLAMLFAACMVCQGELALSRPHPRHLTTFYLTIGAGGALGGVFVALVAPQVFVEFTEYPIGLGVACLLGFVGWMRSGAMKSWRSGGLAVRAPLMALLLGGATAVAAAVIYSGQVGVASWRNFYGVLRVTERTDVNGPLRELSHGRIRHGFQYLHEPWRSRVTSYYGPHSGAGMALAAVPSPRRVAVVGLGTGTLAAFGRAGDMIRFYEIDPDVERAARGWFTYLKNSKARVEVAIGDGRIELERELAAGHRHDFDVIVLDAFNGDAIPTHLLTAECGELYRQRLAPGGALLLHISNRSLNLIPVAEAIAERLGRRMAVVAASQNDATGEAPSTWAVITDNPTVLEAPGISSHLQDWPGGMPPPITWTDDYLSLWHVLRF